MPKKVLKAKDREALLRAAQARFEQNTPRHPGLVWADIHAKLAQHPEKLWSLNEMERTGGEPDVVGFEATTSEYLFYDCAAESPAGRRSLCYDHEALNARKEAKPRNAALTRAAEMGIELLTEAQHRALQALGAFDTKTSSWLKTSPAVRNLGGGLFWRPAL
jgi:hypothetical protein